MPLEWDEVAGCDPAAFTLVTAPARFAERGDASAGIDAAAGSLDGLLALSAAQEAAGLGDAPWPPHYRKQARRAAARRAVARKGAGRPPQSTQPLITVAKAEHKEDALAGLERWKARHPEAAARLAGRRRARRLDARPLDARGRASASTCATCPRRERPAEEPPDPDYDPWRDSAAAGGAPKTRSSS